MKIINIHQSMKGSFGFEKQTASKETKKEERNKPDFSAILDKAMKVYK